MGFLDSLEQMAGNALGAQMGNVPASAQGSMVDTVQNLIQQNGGLSGLLSKFEQNGLGAQVASWVGTDANQPINAQHIMDVLGQSQVGQIAQQLGIDPQQVASHLATVLPEVVNHLTPGGQISPNGAIGEALDLFKSKLGL
jgi:uncharacterized protein YidB (DUF937 family)